MAAYLGLDCGGTRCRVLAVDDSGQVTFEKAGPGVNVSRCSDEELEKSLSCALQESPSVTAVVGAFAGLVDPTQQTRVEAALSRLTACAVVEAVPDYCAALRAAGETDALVIAGTGSVVCSHWDGSVVKSGGGGPMLGDEGSAFDVGRRLIQVMCLGRGAGPVWGAVALESVFGTSEAGTVIKRAYGPDGALLVANLARAVNEAYCQSKEGASEILAPAISNLASVVRAHIKAAQPAIGPAKVSVTGGMWTSDEVVDLFSDILNFRKFVISNSQTDEKSRQYHVVKLSVAPVWGAAQLAKEVANGHRIP